MCLLLAVLFGSYCLVGGLGTTFYISYINTALIFITTSVFVLKTTYLATPEVENITSFNSLYEAVSCIKGPEGNAQESLVTFQSQSGIVYGVLILFMSISITFCDQANWQSKIATKPSEGIFGFIIAGFLWFAIPTSMSYTAALVYETMSFRHGSNLLTTEEIDAGKYLHRSPVNFFMFIKLICAKHWVNVCNRLLYVIAVVCFRHKTTSPL